MLYLFRHEAKDHIEVSTQRDLLADDQKRHLVSIGLIRAVHD